MARTRTPDRFEKLSATKSYALFNGVEVMKRTDAARLLRREHAAVVRAVREKKTHARALHAGDLTAYRNGLADAYDDILAMLKKRKGGKT